MYTSARNPIYRAATLAEIVMVLGIFALMAAIAMPIGLSQLSRNNALQAARDLASNISVMQQNSYNWRNSGEYGVYLTTDEYTLYEGVDYGSSTWSDTVSIRGAQVDQIDFNGAQEVSFTLGSLLPNAAGSFRVSDDAVVYLVTVNSEGLIEITRE
jgi:type II secretory pathway pseudopilin PulG